MLFMASFSWISIVLMLILSVKMKVKSNSCKQIINGGGGGLKSVCVEISKYSDVFF